MKLPNKIYSMAVMLSLFIPIAHIHAKPSQNNKAKSAFLIVPGVSVGPIRLGMTRRQIKTLLGAPQYVYYGHKYYGGFPRESYKDFHLAFNHNQTNGRVVIIEVTSPRYKTKDGFSTQSKFKDIQRRHPHMKIVKEQPFEIWSINYNDQSKGIGFCFEIPLSGAPLKEQKDKPASDQRPVAIGVYSSGIKWKRFYSSE